MSDNPIEERIEAIKDKYSDFHEQVRMPDVTREISDIAEKIKTLPAEIEKVRSRGYVYKSYLEQKAEVLQGHWDDINQRVHKAIDDEVEELREDMDELEKRVRYLREKAIEPLVEQTEGIIADVESKIEAAKTRVSGMYSTLENDVRQTLSQLNRVNWYLDQKDEASFDFLAGESLFLAAKAEWVETGRGKDDPDGILYLTDQRLVFEQKEKTGKKLGMFGGKKEQEVEWELPLNQIEAVEAENKGMLGGKDMLNFTLGGGAPYPAITVEVKGGVDCKFWQKQIQRMVSGNADNERAIEPDPELVEKLRNAPTECHVCSGTLPQIVAGQNQINCEYCGAVIRI